MKLQTFFAFVLMCVEVLKAFSARYGFVRGKIVLLQAIAPSVEAFICRFFYPEFDIPITIPK